MIEIREINQSEIRDVVEIHKKAFKNFFLTELGDKFLSLYYNCVSKHSDGIVLGIYENEKMLGFCAATRLSADFNRRLIKKDFLKFGLEGVKLLFSKPKAVLRLSQNLTKKGEVDDDGNYAELLSIGVDPSIQGKGLGGKLLGELEHVFRLKHVMRISLTTDFCDNKKAIGFYKSLGYNPMYEFVSYPDRKMYRMIKNLQ